MNKTYKDTDLREALRRKYSDTPQLPADFMANMETSQIGIGPILLPHFDLSPLSRLYLKYSHILGNWGLGLQHINCGGIHLSP